MGALAATGSFYCAGYIPFIANVPQLADMILPGTIIKVNCKKQAGIVPQDRVNPDNISSICIFSAKMIIDHCIT